MTTKSSKNREGQSENQERSLRGREHNKSKGPEGVLKGSLQKGFRS